MRLSEKFKRYSKHYYSEARDPYTIGIAAVFAVCAAPFSSTVAVTAAAMPVIYATAGAGFQLVGKGLTFAGH